MYIRAVNRGRSDDTQDSLDRRYQFYIEKVQPCIDYLKDYLGSTKVTLVDAHQPVKDDSGQLNIEASINEVVLSVIHELGLPNYLLDLK
jgi:adenylate kinase family enzyme